MVNRYTSVFQELKNKHKNISANSINYLCHCSTYAPDQNKGNSVEMEKNVTLSKCLHFIKILTHWNCKSNITAIMSIMDKTAFTIFLVSSAVHISN